MKRIGTECTESTESKSGNREREEGKGVRDREARSPAPEPGALPKPQNSSHEKKNREKNLPAFLSESCR